MQILQLPRKKKKKNSIFYLGEKKNKRKKKKNFLQRENISKITREIIYLLFPFSFFFSEWWNNFYVKSIL